MSIKILPLLPTDIPSYVDIEISAFTPHPRWPLLWPNGNSPDLIDYYVSSHSDSLQNDSTCQMMKAVDERTGRIVGVAEWTFCVEEDTGGQSEDDGKPENWPRGGNWEMRKWFKRQWGEWRRAEFGKEGWICLDILVTSPDAQRRGVGTSLLRWGIEEADRLRLPMCLEATPTGFELYKRFGFEQKKVVQKDMRDFGCEKDLDLDASARIYMVRPAVLQ